MSANPALVLAVLTHLGNGRTVVWTANACKLMPRQVLDFAAEYGALRSAGMVDTTAAALAAGRLRTEKNAAIAQQPARQRPAREPDPLSEALDRPLPVEGILRTVPIDDVRPDPLNLRDDVGDVTDLAASLDEVGMLQPIVVRWGERRRLVVVAGHRRLAAARLAGWDTVPVIVRQEMRPDAVIAAMLVENGHRRDLDPIEEARGLRRLQTEAGGCTHAVLAKRIGRTQVHVSARLALLALPVEEQEALRSGTMTLTEAVHKAREASGRVKPKGQDKGWHFGPQHDLAQLVKARCLRLQHPRGRTVGGIGCALCWESVIRADERDHLHTASARRGECATCGGAYRPALNVAGASA